MERLRAGALVVVLVVAALATPLAAAATPSTPTECSNTVTYDAFRFDNATVSKAANDSATARAQNTEVTVEQATGFVRIKASNPNGYCVEVHVRLDEAIVAPAELGAVENNGGHVTAEWRAVRDFEREETYTEVVFTLPAATSATFAPSKLRVKSLSWTGTAKSEGASVWDKWTDVSWGDEPDLEQRTYTFSAQESTETITVSLRDDTTGREVEEWQAMYRSSNDSGWTPVSTDSSAPVFYREVDDHRVQFVFNDPSAEVRFTANPDTWDKADHQWESWWSGTNAVEEFIDGLFD